MFHVFRVISMDENKVAIKFYHIKDKKTNQELFDCYDNCSLYEKIYSEGIGNGINNINAKDF